MSARAGGATGPGKLRMAFMIAAAMAMCLCVPVRLIAADNDVSADIAVTPGNHNLTIPPIPDGSEVAEITVTITAAPGWNLVELDPAPDGWFGTYQRLYDGMSPGEAYGGVFTGELEPIAESGGGGDGGEPDYTFTVNADGTSVKPEYRIRPDEQTVCVGQGAEFFAEKRLDEMSPWELKVSNWRLDGAERPPAASSKTFVTNTSGIYTVTAETNGLSDSATLTIIKVESVTSDRDVCWDGGSSVNHKTINFTAVPTPAGASFPPGGPTWTATAGSFIGGNSGEQVIWAAPSGSGGEATITASCGSSSAGKTVTYVYVSPPTWSGPLYRSQSNMESVTHAPTGYMVNLYDDTNDPELGRLLISGYYATAENLIEKAHLIPMRDTLHGKISAVIPDNDIRILFWDINLQKWIDDAWYVKEIQNAHDVAAYGAEQFASTMQDKVKQALLAQSLSSSVSELTAQGARLQAKAVADTLYGELISKLVPEHEAKAESAEATWSPDVSVTVGDATISPGEWGNAMSFINAVNSAGGFTHAVYIFDAGVVATWPLKSSDGSGTINLSIKINLTYQDGAVDFNSGSGGLILRYTW